MKPYISTHGELHVRVYHFAGASLLGIIPALIFALDIGMNWAIAREGSRWSAMSASDFALFLLLNGIALAVLGAILYFAEFQTTLVLSGEAASITHRTALRASHATYSLASIGVFRFSCRIANRSFLRDTDITLILLSGDAVPVMTFPYPFQGRRAHTAMLDFLSAHGHAHLVGNLPPKNGGRS